jgi:hypothetical protein
MIVNRRLTMYSTDRTTPAIDYLIRKNTLRKKKFVIKSKIIVASYITFGLYLVIRYFGHNIINAAHVIANIEPIIFTAVAAIIYSVYSMSFKRG